MFYIRFGEIPKDERSSIHYRGMYCGKEEGVSVYDCVFIRGQYHIIVPCPVSEGGLNTLTDFLFYEKDKPVYFVEGEQVGTGHDGEPLIRNVKIIADITDRFRHMQSSIDEDKLHDELLSRADKFKEERKDKDNNVRNLTDEETEIYESQIDYEAKDTGVNIMDGDAE